MIYTKQDLQGLTIETWTSLQGFFDKYPPSQSLISAHLVISSTAWLQIVSDPLTPSFVEPVIRHAQLLQGYIADLSTGPSVITDAYDLERFFDGAVSAYVLVPFCRIKPLPDIQDPASFLVE